VPGATRSGLSLFLAEALAPNDRSLTRPSRSVSCSSSPVAYVVINIDLNVNRWLAAKPQLEAIFQQVTGATFKQYGKLKFPAPINPAAN